ncbi:hypothetical protein HDU93_008430, partial [Gonapodya sp. JEL0774]
DFHSTSVAPWQGRILIRMKFDDQGRIYDSAIFAERMAELDTLIGHLMDQPGVEDLLLQSRIRLQNVPFGTLMRHLEDLEVWVD